MLFFPIPYYLLIKVMEGLTGMEAPNAPISPQYEEKNNIIENSQEIRPPGIPPVASESANSFIGATPTLFETCLALSCNPSGSKKEKNSKIQKIRTKQVYLILTKQYISDPHVMYIIQRVHV